MNKLVDWKNRLKDRHMLSVVVVLFAIIIAMGIWIYKKQVDYRQASENQYNMAFYELVNYVQDVETYLAKSLISSTSEHGAETLTNVWKEANLAQVYLSRLPIESVELENTAKFLNQVSDYSFSLSRKNIKNEKLTQEDLDNLKELHNYSDIKAVDEAGYAEIPDVLFVCVKGYSIPDIIPFLREHSDAETLIVPILNIYGTGAKLQQALPDATVVDGCIYIAAEIKEPGVILQKGDIFRIVFGARKGQALCRKMFLLEQELKAAGIDAVLSDQIERDAFQKYAYVSPMAACGLYYDATAEVFQRAGEERMLLIRCMKEIDALATAMGIPFLVDIEKTNLDILDALVPEASTSMQRDIWAGKPSEIDGLLYEPLRLGEQYGVEMPNYEMIVKVLKEKYGE